MTTAFTILEATCADCGNTLSYQFVKTADYSAIKQQVCNLQQYCLPCASMITEVSHALEIAHLPHHLQDADQLPYAQRTAPSITAHYRNVIGQWCIANNR